MLVTTSCIEYDAHMNTSDTAPKEARAIVKY